MKKSVLSLAVLGMLSAAPSVFAQCITYGEVRTPSQPITAVNTGAYSAAEADHTTAAGYYSSAQSEGATATGSSSKAECKDSTAMGYGAYAAAPGASALGAHAIASHENSVAIGNNTQTTQANEVAVGGRRVTQVGNGSISQGSTDAINGGQLWEVMQGMGGSNFDETLWNDRWENINNRFGAVDKRLNGLGAQMGAMSMMAATPGEGGITLGVGFSGGETALAVGWSRRLSERTSIAVGAAFGGGNKAVIGVGLRIGGR